MKTRKEYEAQVAESIWPFLDEYVRVHMPILTRGDSCYLLPSRRTGGRWGTMGKHFFRLTARYFRGCPGVGPHAMRSIIGTAVANVNGVEIAALVIGDRVSTAKKHYIRMGASAAGRLFDKVTAKK